ncbi:MAG: hypothetical protein GKS06_09985 [Acidobacteria bacterium]|nr:hypothetical protein [Acidobacteriota bacterium]
MGAAMQAETETSTREIRFVEKRIEFDAPIERVWDAITDPAQIAKWFPDEVEIDEMAAPERLVWRWAKDPGTPLEETTQTTVQWNLEPRDGGGTVLRLRESGFVSDDDQLGNDGGWDKELDELVEFLLS